MALWLNLDSQLAQPRFVKVGQVEFISIAAGGTGYTDGASITLSAPPAGGVQAVATIAVTGGVITGINITNPGAGYTSAPTATVAGGANADLRPFVRGIADANDTIVFVSQEEAQLASNRLKGIKTPGWSKVTSKVDQEGNTRYFVSPIIAVNVLNATSGDAKGDDLVVGDADITITAQPVAASVTAPATATFTVTATGATTYQWQVKIGSAAYVNVSTGTGGTTASYTTAATVTGDSGKLFRCVIGNGGTAQVTTKAAKLTVA